ncbi:MAG: hypothetical protein LBM06_07985 [Prevotellaceae bacterium]|jgi:hypothetical protein|nr:hypothetical protein [Prevotellaceae bacterium]
MKIKNLPLLVFAQLLVMACGEESNFFRGKIKHHYQFEVEQTLTGSLVSAIDTIGVLSLDFYDDYKIISLYDSKYLMQLYRGNSNRFIGNFFQTGHGPNDFLSLSVLNQPMDSLLVMQDYYRRKVLFAKIVDDKPVLLPDRTISYADCKQASQVFYVNDSLLLVKDRNSNLQEIVYRIYNYVQHRTVKEISLYSVPLRLDDTNLFMTVADGLKPDKTKLVSLTGTFNQIDILDLQDEANSFSVQTSKENFTLTMEEARKRPIQELPDYYLACPVCNDDYIFALYQNTAAKRKEFHVINWAGETLYRLPVREDLRGFNIDWKNGILYGITRNDQVYAYNMNLIATFAPKS